MSLRMASVASLGSRMASAGALTIIWRRPAHFNFCRTHEALRVTPAMAQRLTDHVWTIGELLTACLNNAPAKPRKVHRRFTVIEGGKAE